MINDAHMSDLTRSTNADLFRLYQSILAELRRRCVLRTNNAPCGDYSEYLVTRAFAGTLVPNSKKSVDVLAPDGRRLQVKGRVISDPPKKQQLQLSAFRSFEFDWLVVVLLSNVDYGVIKAASIPVNIVEPVGKLYTWTNSSTIYATYELMEHADAIDVTDAIRQVQTEDLTHRY